jgi:hypothetical protein
VNPTTKARLVAYIGSALIGIAMLLKMMGLATYDEATHMFDLAPIDVYALAGLIAGPIGSLLAAFAVVGKWGHPK